MGYLRLAFLAVVAGTSTALAASSPCPLPPSGINYDSRSGWDYFVDWCQNSVHGQVLTDDRGVQGCYNCPLDARPASIAAPVALFVGVPVTTGALAALLKLAGESTKDPTAVSDTNDPTGGYGKAFAIGAGTGLAAVTVSYGVVKMTQASKAAGLTMLGGVVGAAGGAFTQSLANDRKTPEQKQRDDDSGKTTEEYKSSTLKGAAIGAPIGLAVGLITDKFSADFRALPIVRRNPWLRRASFSTSQSISGITRLSVVVK